MTNPSVSPAGCPGTRQRLESRRLRCQRSMLHTGSAAIVLRLLIRAPHRPSSASLILCLLSLNVWEEKSGQSLRLESASAPLLAAACPGRTQTSLLSCHRFTSRKKKILSDFAPLTSKTKPCGSWSQMHLRMEAELEG